MSRRLSTRCLRICRRSDEPFPVKVLALITARGGSKGIPRKNLALVGGKPLLAWTIEAARRSSRVDRVVLSTDDADIAAAGRQFGAEVPFLRPKSLATDTAGSLGVALHVLDWAARESGGEPEYLLILQPTSPLRASEDIDGAIELALERRAPAVLGVRETVSPTHPYDSWKLGPAGEIEAFIKVDAKPTRRQDYPPAYVTNGALYLIRPAALRETGSFQPPGTLAFLMPAERSIDIDTPLDLQIADFLLRQWHVQSSCGEAPAGPQS